MGIRRAYVKAEGDAVESFLDLVGDGDSSPFCLWYVLASLRPICASFNAYPD